jgi:hypothetical protein
LLRMARSRNRHRAARAVRRPNQQAALPMTRASAARGGSADRPLPVSPATGGYGCDSRGDGKARRRAEAAVKRDIDRAEPPAWRHASLRKERFKAHPQRHRRPAQSTPSRRLAHATSNSSIAAKAAGPKLQLMASGSEDARDTRRWMSPSNEDPCAEERATTPDCGGNLSKEDLSSKKSRSSEARARGMKGRR